MLSGGGTPDFDRTPRLTGPSRPRRSACRSPPRPCPTPTTSTGRSTSRRTWHPGTINFSLTDGLQTITGTLTIVAGPTVTAVTAVGTLTAGGLGETVGITGTNFVNGMGCTTNDPAVTCFLLPQGTDSSTIRTVVINPIGPAALNGSDSISVTDPTTEGVGTLAGAFIVSGQPTYTGVSPATVTQGTDPTITVTGTLVPATLNYCAVFYTDSLGNVTPDGGCAATYVSATSFTVGGYAINVPPGDNITFTVGTAGVSVATTPGVLCPGDPVGDGDVREQLRVNRDVPGLQQLQFPGLRPPGLGQRAVQVRGHRLLRRRHVPGGVDAVDPSHGRDDHGDVGDAARDLRNDQRSVDVGRWLDPGDSHEPRRRQRHTRARLPGRRRAVRQHRDAVGGPQRDVDDDQARR